MNVNVSASRGTPDAESMNAGDALDAKIASAVADYEALYEATLHSLQQMIQQLFASEDFVGQGDIGDAGQGGDGAAGSGGSDMTAQAAAGALAAYMQQNGTAALNPDELYALAYDPKEGTPAAVSNAAHYMLAHPDTYNRIETHDVPGSDGISGVGNFEWAAQGGLDEA